MGQLAIQGGCYGSTRLCLGWGAGLGDPALGREARGHTATWAELAGYPDPLLAATPSARALRPRGPPGRRPVRGQVPGLHPAAVGTEPAPQHPHGTGPGSCGPRQGEAGLHLLWAGLPRVSGAGGTPTLAPCAPQAPDGETQPMTPVDLFVSTKRIKVLMANAQVPTTAWGRREQLGGPRGRREQRGGP